MHNSNASLGYNKLPVAEKEDLHRKMLVFLDEVRFERCGGFEITEEAKVIVAAQACFLVLNRPKAFFSRLKSVLIYPDTYVAQTGQSFGFTGTSGSIPVAGQSYGVGTVVLSWKHVCHGGRNDNDGHNVVFHEFAHQIDQQNGQADGLPVMTQRTYFKPWIETVGGEFEKFVKRVQKHRKSVMDSYGATNPAEFFAVATETFFEKPWQLYRKHAAMYGEFQNYYKCDPREWV